MIFIYKTTPETWFSRIKDKLITKFCQRKLIREFDYYMAFHIEELEKFKKEHPLFCLVNHKWEIKK